MFLTKYQGCSPIKKKKEKVPNGWRFTHIIGDFDIFFKFQRQHNCPFYHMFHKSLVVKRGKKHGGPDSSTHCNLTKHVQIDKTQANGENMFNNVMNMARTCSLFLWFLTLWLSLSCKL